MPRRADIDINVRANARAVGELQKGFQATERSAVKGFERIGQAGIKAFRDTERARERAFGKRQSVGGFAQTINQTKAATRSMDQFASSIKQIPKEFESAERRTKRSLTSIEDRLKRAFGTRGGIGGRRGSAPLVRGALTGFDTTIKQIKEQERALETARGTTKRYSDSFIALRKQVSRTTETVRNFVSRGLRGLQNFGSGNLRQLSERFRRFGNSVGRSLSTAGSRFRRFVRRIQRGVGTITKSMGRISIRFGLIGQAIRKVVGSVVGAIRSTVSTITALLAGLGITRAFNAVVEGGKRAELAIIQLGTLFRTTREEAKELFFAVRAFARPLPVTTDQVVSAFIRLRSVGIQPTSERLRGLINASLALGRPLENIVLAVQSLETESLRKLGINLDRRGEQAILNFGSQTILLPKDDRKIREGLIDLFNSAFGGALERSLKNFQVNVDVLRSVIGDTSAELGLKFLNPLTKIVQRTTAWLEVNRDIVNLKLGRFFENVGQALLDLASVENINFLFEQFFNFIDKIANSPQTVVNFFRRVKDTVVSFIGTIRELTNVLTSLLKVIISVFTSLPARIAGIKVPDELVQSFLGSSPVLAGAGTTTPGSTPGGRFIAQRLGFSPKTPTVTGGGGNDFSDSLVGVDVKSRDLSENNKALDDAVDRTNTFAESLAAVTRELNSTELAFLQLRTQLNKDRNAARDFSSLLGSELDFSGANLSQLNKAITTLVRIQTRPESRRFLLQQQIDFEESTGDSAERVALFSAATALPFDVRSLSNGLNSAIVNALNLGQTGQDLTALTRFLQDTGDLGLAAEARGHDIITSTFIGAEAARVASLIPPTANLEEINAIIASQFDRDTESGRANFARLDAQQDAFFLRRAGRERSPQQRERFQREFDSGLAGNVRKMIEALVVIQNNTVAQTLHQLRIERNTQRMNAVFEQSFSRGFREFSSGNFSKGLKTFFTGLRSGLQDTFTSAVTDQLTGETSIFKNLESSAGTAIQDSLKFVSSGLGSLFDKAFGGITTRERKVSERIVTDPETGEKTIEDVTTNKLAGAGRDILGGLITAVAAGQQGPLEGLLGGGLAGASLGAQFGGPPGAVIGGIVGAGVGLFSSLFGSDKTRRINIDQQASIDPFGGANQQAGFSREVTTGGFGVPVETRTVRTQESPIQIDSKNISELGLSTGVISRSLFKIVEDFANAWLDLFVNLPPELFNAFTDGFQIPAGTLDFDVKNQEAEKIQRKLQDFFSGAVGRLIPAVEDVFINGLAASGLSAEGQDIFRRRIDEIEGATDDDERKLLSDEFLKDLAAFTEATAILENTATGLENMSAVATNLSTTLGFSAIPTMEEFNEGLREVRNTGNLSPEALERWKRLRETLLAIPGEFQQRISTTISGATAFSDVLDLDPATLSSITSATRNAAITNRAFASNFEGNIDERLKFLQVEQGYLNDIIALERQKFESEREAAQEVKNIYDSVKTLGDSIESSLLSLRTGSDSPLSPAQRVGVVQGSIASLQAQLAGTEGTDRVRILERLSPLFTQLAGLGSAFGAGSPEARAVFAQGEAGLTALLDDEEFRSQGERLTEIGDTLEQQFTLSQETKDLIEGHRDDNYTLLSELIRLQGGSVPARVSGSSVTVTPSGNDDRLSGRRVA